MSKINLAIVALFLSLALALGFSVTPHRIAQGKSVAVPFNRNFKLSQSAPTALQSHPHHRKHHGNSLRARLHEIFNRRILQNAMASGFAFTISDVVAQTIAMKTTRKIDFFRVLRMCSFGFFVQGPLGTFFHRALHKSMPSINSSVLFKRIFAEQLLWMPSYALLMITYLGIISGYSPQMIHRTINTTNTLSRIIATSWCLWVPTHVISYFIMPRQLKPFFLNLVQFLANIVHSMIVNS